MNVVLNILYFRVTGFTYGVENSGLPVHYVDDKAARTTPWIKVVSKKKRRPDVFRSEYICSSFLMDKQTKL
jgi:hypothetical protein